MKLSVACLMLFACMPTRPPDPYAGQPAASNGGYQATNDQMWGACQQQANEQLAVCNGVRSTGKNTNSAWEIRGAYDRISQTCPTHAHDGLLGQLEQCTVGLESFELAADPQAPTRRRDAKPRVEVTKQDATFKKLIDDWMQALDGKNITCRNREASDSDARECERWHGEMTKVEDKLAAFLVTQGYDKRDLRPLGLWPQDPDWRISPN
jgi:hypothetical protein